uniref:Uncharacterized protein n=1 Tax=Pristionchus pacificus TaxID=54126 RepID=A0A454Y1U0_PRIPA|eukprot:PDM71496.1 hypothetical protein PRIPAC_37903 [Pristionchus pacificus]
MKLLILTFLAIFTLAANSATIPGMHCIGPKKALESRRNKRDALAYSTDNQRFKRLHNNRKG